MATNFPPDDRAVLRAYFDAVILAEPMQLSLWKSARVTLTQLRILRRLHDAPLNAGELARASGVSAPSLTRLLDRLEEEGYVERTTVGNDRRRVEVALSERGRHLIEGRDLVQRGPFEKAVQSMDPERRRALLEALEDFTARLRAQIASAEQGGKES